MIEEGRRKVRYQVGIILLLISAIWLVLPVSKSQLVIPHPVAIILLLPALLYLSLTYYFFPNLRIGRSGLFLNFVDLVLVSFGVAVAGGIKSIFVFFNCPLIIESALFYGPLLGAVTGFSATILTIISSLIYSQQFESSLWHSNLLILLILHPFLGWLIGEISKKEMEASFRERDLPPFWKEKLTSREIEIILLVAEGKTNSEIASELGRSEKTIKNHLSAIYRKLEVSSRYELLASLRKGRKE